ncbi:MAG: T9SS type A sorting domain-containing protein, partial [Bacteroidota bacterium]
VRGLTASGTKVYGTIDLGVTTANLPIGGNGPTEGPNTAVIYRVLYWVGEGYADATGVVLANAGARFGVDRARRCEAIGIVRATFDRRVVLTGLTPEEVIEMADQPCGRFSAQQSRLGVGDAILVEGYQVRDGAFASAADWRTEADALADVLEGTDVRVFSLATGETYSGDAFRYAWFSALVDEHAATGWADTDRGASDNQPVLFAAPDAAPGRVFVNDTEVDLPTVQRTTEGGTVTIRTDTRQAFFGAPPVSNDDAPVPEVVVVDLGASYPNPTRGRTTVPFRLGESGPVRLAVYDLLGREVAVLRDAVTPAGTHTATLDARYLASGVYVVRLSAGDRYETRRLTVVR